MVVLETGAHCMVPSVVPGFWVLSSGALSFCGQRWFEAGGLLEVKEVDIQPH